MSSHLSKDLKTKYEVRAVPVRKGDTVKVMRGTYKGREGKIQTVYRKRWAIHIEKLTREKTNGKCILPNISYVKQEPKLKSPYTHHSALLPHSSSIRAEKLFWKERREFPRKRTSTRKVWLVSTESNLLAPSYYSILVANKMFSQYFFNSLYISRFSN